MGIWIGDLDWGFGLGIWIGDLQAGVDRRELGRHGYPGGHPCQGFRRDPKGGEWEAEHTEPQAGKLGRLGRVEKHQMM